jgi:hypothetical protein
MHGGPPMINLNIWDHYKTFVLFKHVLGLSHAFNWDILNLFRTCFWVLCLCNCWLFMQFLVIICAWIEISTRMKKDWRSTWETLIKAIYIMCARDCGPHIQKYRIDIFAVAFLGSACWKVDNLHTKIKARAQENGSKVCALHHMQLCRCAILFPGVHFSLHIRFTIPGTPWRS